MTPAATLKTAPAPRHDGIWLVLVLVLLVWFGLILFAGRAAIFEAGPDRPPLTILLAILLPPGLFALAYRLSGRVRDWAHSLDLRLLTAMQAWRVIGIMFLALYAFGLLPGFFAWPAGLGDVAVGAGAVFALRAMLAQRAGWERRVLWLNIAGLADFVGAIATGVLSSNSMLGVFASAAPTVSMGSLPLSLVPTFGVPLWTVLHIISLIQLRRIRAG